MRVRDQLAGPGWSQVWSRAVQGQSRTSPARRRALKGIEGTLDSGRPKAQWTAPGGPGRPRGPRRAKASLRAPKRVEEGPRGPAWPLTASNQRAVPTVLAPVPSSVLPSRLHVVSVDEPSSSQSFWPAVCRLPSAVYRPSVALSLDAAAAALRGRLAMLGGGASGLEGPREAAVNVP
ncbi:hypothetical protein G7Z17_g10513 [Cylindrodendrum hubeiense]|uniref:Uncharacterized protein n=1 Tax=Cylindrodendrum hubeiense TaxID=595255 RepID=A0A9P5H1C5_9HYPO|nr:hypothetical protein G7Z17_g10513 [Cylindrodendrum hubeiense]